MISVLAFAALSFTDLVSRLSTIALPFEGQSHSCLACVSRLTRHFFFLHSVHGELYLRYLPVLTEARGTKVHVTYDSVEILKTFHVTELPSHPAVYPFLPKEQLQNILAVLGQWTEAGDFNLPEEEAFNRQRSPDIKLRSMAEMLQEAWGAVTI